MKVSKSYEFLMSLCVVSDVCAEKCREKMDDFRGLGGSVGELCYRALGRLS